jgi:predicted RNase H-like HicB family nuclease
MKTKLTAVLRREEGDYVALNPELDIASQGSTRDEALLNLQEAVELFLECASSNEIAERLSGETWITQFEAEYAQA